MRPDLLGGIADVDRLDPDLRAWTAERVARLEADARRSADTHLLRLALPAAWGIDLYLKDESTHHTGSLKHRLARSLFMYALGPFHDTYFDDAWVAAQGWDLAPWLDVLADELPVRPA